MPNRITAAQLYYVTKVYPEPVTDEEAREDYDKTVTSDDERAYWESAANVLNRMAGASAT